MDDEDDGDDDDDDDDDDENDDEGFVGRLNFRSLGLGLWV